MNFYEAVKIAAKSIGDNKLRSALTTLGIVIGVGAVIALVSVAQGASYQVTSVFENMGANLIMITPVRNAGGQLYLEDVQELEERVSTIRLAAASVNFSATAKFGTTSYDTSIEGVSENYPVVRELTLARGRFISEQDVTLRSQVAVLGTTVVEELFGYQDPLGETVYLYGQPFNVIGVMESKGFSLGRDSDDVIYIPVTVAQRLNGTKQVGTIYAQATSSEDAPLAVLHLEAIFNHRFPREDAVRITSQDELLSAVSEATQSMTMMLAAIAGISLLVGGIGIMNIMLVSVTERTREIGIRKAIGAKGRDILGQFLVESMLLSIVGGGLGILLGMGAASIISRSAGWVMVISPQAIILAFIFSAAVGLFFGVYPARKAANLDPIEALRHE